MDAYILISLKDCDEQTIVEELQSHEEVKEAHILFGEWDLMLKLKAESPEAVSTFVLDHVRRLDEVQLTSTLIVAK